ncbi:alpha/beta hydrolase [Streptomyces sp. MS1.HAVA.3]|uniref:Alpha/beta hydrolase n=1 Tax=Streptomyces caledonius TaxID=3134107 RepID=A0ABU8U7K9_9ACTN
MRHELRIDDRTLSYLDFGGPGRPLLALHGGMSEAAAFTGLAAALGDAWRVIAPDQRGHGGSDRAADHHRAGYVADAVALLDHLGLDAPCRSSGTPSAVSTPTTWPRPTPSGSPRSSAWTPPSRSTSPPGPTGSTSSPA